MQLEEYLNNFFSVRGAFSSKKSVENCTKMVEVTIEMLLRGHGLKISAINVLLESRITV